MPTIEELTAQLNAEKEAKANLQKELEGLKAKPPEKKDPPETTEDDLLKKTAQGKKDADDKKSESQKLEKALKFTMTVETFVKDNADALPSEFSDILKTAEKETYDSQAEKASALKAAMVQSFFQVQDNRDLLTASQKAQLDDYLKLTKNGKEEKAEHIFENLLEPALESLKRVKKATELGKARAGFATSTKVEDQYKARLMQVSRKTYLGEKGAH